MLNEAYAPTCFADLAWSRQKSTALSTFIRHLRSSNSGGGAGGSKDSAAGSQSPRILLLYGPAGCGKLSSLQVLLREDVSPAATSRPASAAPSTPTLTPTQSHVFHTCEATVQAYAQFLQQTIAHCSGQLLGTALDLSSSATAPQASQRRDADSPAHHAHIVKFYGEPASHALHRCTLLFVRQYEELCAQAMMQQQQQQQARLSGGSAAASLPSLLEQLRRNPVFFIHTTHDTHNDKVDINTSFPAAVLQSTAVELFHCTAITEINLKKRLKQVLEQEAVRRAQRRAQTEKCVDVDEMDTAVVCSAVSGKRSKAAARGGGGRGGTAKGRKLSVSASNAASAAAHQKGSKTAAVAPSHMSFLDVIDGAALDAIAAGSQGDIRQALLQIQWTALLPPEGESGAALRSAASPSSLAHQEANQIWDRLRERRRLRECVATAGPSPCPPATGESKAAVDDAVSPGPTQDSTVSGDEDVILISSSSSSSSDVSAVSASPSPSLGMTAEVVSSGGKEASPSRRSAETSRKRARSPPAVTDMLSLLDAQMSTADLLSTTPTPSAAKTGRSGSTTAAAVEHRSVLPTTRDEYLGLSHATGRLLSQKYDINEVLDILNVAPRKMLDYLTNSQIRFFRDTQLPQYSACAAAASDTDALRVSDYGSGSGGGATGVSAAALRERRQLADRTAAGDSVGNVARLLDVVALHIFHGTHLVKQTDVFVPSTFVPMEPPPFLRSAYPRLRDVAVPSNTGRAAREDAGVADSEFSEQEWTQRFLLRLDGASTPSAGRAGPLGGRARTGGGLYGGPSLAASATSPRIQMDEVDIAREGLPDLLCRCGCTDSVVMDYLALAPYIVLTLEPPYTTATPPPSSLSKANVSATQSLQKVKGELGIIHSMPVKQEEGVVAATAISAASADSKPRRTVFKFAAASTSSQSGGSPAVSSSSSPSSLPAPSTMPHRVPSQRPCTVLQCKILQRGRDESKAALRADNFVLVAAEDTAAEGAMDATGGVEERPWMPDGEDIEDD